MRSYLLKVMACLLMVSFSSLYAQSTTTITTVETPTETTTTTPVVTTTTPVVTTTPATTTTTTPTVTTTGTAVVVDRPVIVTAVPEPKETVPTPAGYTNCFTVKSGWYQDVWIAEHQVCQYSGSPSGVAWVEGYWMCNKYDTGEGKCTHWEWKSPHWEKTLNVY